MNPTLSEITVDLLLIVRVLLALSFGFGYAAWLQFTDKGQWLAEKRTWFTVVIGVGGCFIIGFNADYWTLLIIFALASVGIIIRSLHNEIKTEQKEPTKNISNSYNTKQSIDAVLMELVEINTGIVTLLNQNKLPERVTAALGQWLGQVDYCKEALRAARKGKFVEKKH